MILEANVSDCASLYLKYSPYIINPKNITNPISIDVTFFRTYHVKVLVIFGLVFLRPFN